MFKSSGYPMQSRTLLRAIDELATRLRFRKLGHRRRMRWLRLAACSMPFGCRLRPPWKPSSGSMIERKPELSSKNHGEGNFLKNKSFTACSSDGIYKAARPCSSWWIAAAHSCYRWEPTKRIIMVS